MLRRAWLIPSIVASLLVAFALTSCGAGPKKLYVRGDQTEQVRSMFLVVGQQADFEAADESGKIEALTDSGPRARYRVYMEFAPDRDKPGHWKQSVSERSDPAYVTVEIPEKTGEVVVTIKRDLLKVAPQATAAVLTNCGNLGWHIERVGPPDLAAGPKLVLRISDTQIQRATE
jgi:hypothetical protein